MTAATFGVIGTTEWVLIAVALAFMLGIAAVAGVVLWKVIKREQGRRREVN